VNQTKPKPLSIRNEFPPVPVAEWEAQIAKDLKGADYQKRLVSKTDEGIAVKPYYTAADLPADEQPQVPGGKPWEMSAPLADVDAARFLETGATAVQELAFALVELARKKGPASVRFAIGSNFFFEIAKLRAARVLWARLGRKEPLRIYAVTALSNKTLYDPYNNLLRASAEALAGVLGGCDALTVIPFRFDARLAENVQHILREESHLARVADPSAGSYYIEAITHALSEEAWKLYQTSPAPEKINEAIAKSRAAKEAAFASRRKVLVGTNNYPNWKERLEHPDEVEGWRLAGLFERIRLRTERYAQKAGKTPRVLLLERGDLKMRKARASFCMNFFGCAGFELKHSPELKEADLVVLCSSDPEYIDIAKDVCPKAHVPVLVAGNPKDHIEALKAAGVAGFVHLGSNAVETLTEWQDKLGVTA